MGIDLKSSCPKIGICAVINCIIVNECQLARSRGRNFMDYLVIILLVIGIIILWKLTKKLLSLALIVVLVYFIYVNFGWIKEFIPFDW